jgi:exodeoxyribonuclease III
VKGVLIGCLYLPNGNPQPGPKFQYKLTWFERLIAHAVDLQAANVPVVLAGDYNVVPTDFDIYNTRSGLKNALLQPKSRLCYRRLLEQGWIDSLRALHPTEPMYTFWHYLRDAWSRGAGLRLDHLLLSRTAAKRLKRAGVDRRAKGGRPGPATMPQPGSSWHDLIKTVTDDEERRLTQHPKHPNSFGLTYD